LLRRIENVIQRREQINRQAAARQQIEEDMIPTQAGVGCAARKGTRNAWRTTFVERLWCGSVLSRSTISLDTDLRYKE
jgi:hypothetical protein